METDKNVQRFMQDDFFRQFIVRFVLCLTLLKTHVAFKEPHHFPQIVPSLPSDLLMDSSSGLLKDVVLKIQELVGLVNVTSMYNFESLSAEGSGAPTS